MSPLPPATRRFLPEVQALRALAVLAVVAYHLEPRMLPGGFVGVDVFFVISGFLITGHLLRELRNTGTVNLPSFWAARARRILPAALATVVAVLAATLVLAPMTQWGTATRHALASALSVENWLLAAAAVDYLAADEPPSALQHFWSLGVEEQFYLVWPLVMLAVVAVLHAGAARGRHVRAQRDLRGPLLLVFGVVILASLACSIILTRAGDPAAYFATPTRVWELAVGGILAVVMAPRGDGAALRLPRWVPSGHSRALLVLAGVGAIGAALFRYDGATPFPGHAAALPVLGTAAVILAGRTSGPLSLHRVVDLPAVQWVGNVSFSLYLVHWPLVVFHAQLSGDEPGPLASVGLLGASLLLAGASHRFVEVPARHWKPLARSSVLALGAGAAAIAVVAGLALAPASLQNRIVASEQSAARQLLAAPPAGFGAAAVPAGAPAFVTSDRRIVPLPAEAAGDRPELGGCIGSPTDRHTRECGFGPEDAEMTVALVGDSHATQWYEAVSSMAEGRNWRLLTYLKDSCPFGATPRTAEESGSITCSEPNSETLERLLDRGDVDAVITSAWSGSRYGTDPAPGFAEYWGQLEDAGIGVYAIADTPRPGRDGYARDCVVAHAQDLEECGQKRSAAFEPVDWMKAAGRLEPRASLLDFTDRFCAGDRCPAVVGNVLVYRDKHHISDTYIRTLAPVFAGRLEAALGSDGPTPRAEGQETGAGRTLRRREARAAPPAVVRRSAHARVPPSSEACPASCRAGALVHSGRPDAPCGRRARLGWGMVIR